MFKVFRTEEFERLMHKLLTKEQQDRVIKIEEEISKVGFTGDPLGLNFLREKRISEKRIYFLIYEDLKSVLMVSISNKKTQQETIDKIKEYLPEFRRLMDELIKTT
ncbi:MAG: hypothetical protein AABY07_00685 [Nanoarchaeota archaeon]